MTSTLTAAREAERAAHEKAALAADLAAAATKHREQVEREEAARPTVPIGQAVFRLSADGTRFEARSIDPKYDSGWRVSEYHDVEQVALLASLLPRKPVEVTEAMVEKAVEAYRQDVQLHGYLGDPSPAMRAALSAVAAGLSAPVAVAAPTLGEPDGYVAKRRSSVVDCMSLASARLHARRLTDESSWLGEYGVYALHRVPDETEGAANG